MKNKLIVLLLLLVTLPANTVLFAQQNNGELNVIHTVVPFLIIAPDSRAGGMGDVGVATSPDVNSMHWNPAKFAFIDGNGGAGLSYSPWLRNLVPDINIAYLTGYKRIDRKQVISGGLLYSSLGDIEFRDEYSPDPTMIFRANEFAFELGYSRLLTDNFSGGIAFRYLNSNLTGGVPLSGGAETKPGRSFAADISGYYQKDISIFDKDGLMAFGLNFSNIGSKMSYSDDQTSDFIPMNMRLGGAGTIHLDSYNSITLSLDLNKLLVPTSPVYYNKAISDSIVAGKDPNVSVPVAIFQSFYDAPGGFKEEMREISYALGLEYWYNNQFAIRGGYFHENETKGNRKYFTTGAGFRMKSFSLDFSYLMPLVQNHPLARTLRFSLAFDFNALRNAGR